MNIGWCCLHSNQEKRITLTCLLNTCRIVEVIKEENLTLVRQPLLTAMSRSAVFKVDPLGESEVFYKILPFATLLSLAVFSG